jgi:hypothetical protein
MFQFFAEQRYNIPGRVVALLYLPPMNQEKDFPPRLDKLCLGGRKPEFITEP